MMGTENEHSLTSSYMDSYKPPTPPAIMDEPQYQLPQVHGNTYAYAQPSQSSRSLTPMTNAGYMQQTAMLSQEELEERRRRALREKERELAARQRQKELLMQRREMELKRRTEEENLRREQEAGRLAMVQREDREREEKRLQNMAQLEEQQRLEDEERRKKMVIEKKREQTLRQIEMQRLREEESQRVRREAILKKRKEMERVRDQAEKTYADKKQEEMQRKMSLVEEMKQKREERLLELEKRRTNPLLIQQEREFNQLIELQASVGRLQTKLEELQSKREDIRERLLEARHVAEMLEIEERQVSIGVEEVEADLKKMKGYQEGLSRLVSTRYDDDEYENAVVKIQKLFRGRKDRALGKRLKAAKEQMELEKAAIKIQKIQRGRKIRLMQKDEKMVKATIKMQRIYRGWAARKRVNEKKKAMGKEKYERHCAETIQNSWRSHTARAVFRTLREERRQKRIVQEELAKQRSQQKQQAEMQRGGKRKPTAQKRGPKTSAQPRKAVSRESSARPILREGELSRIYKSAPRDKNLSGIAPYQTPRARRFIPTAATAAIAQNSEQLSDYQFAREDVSRAALPELTQANLSRPISG